MCALSAVSHLLEKHNVEVRRGRADLLRNQGIVERFNRTLADRLFEHQSAQEMRLPSGELSSEWVAWLPAVVAALDGERLTSKRHKSPHLLSRVAMLVSKSHCFLYQRMFAISSDLFSSKVGVAGRPTPSGG